MPSNRHNKIMAFWIGAFIFTSLANGSLYGDEPQNDPIERTRDVGPITKIEPFSQGDMHRLQQKTAIKRDNVEKISITSKHKNLELEQRFREKWEEIESYERVNQKRAARSHTINYGGDHPFELLKRRRMKETVKYDLSGKEDDMILNNGHERKLSPWSPNSVYEPLRIHIDIEFMSLIDEGRY